jgi:hypothetical protein
MFWRRFVNISYIFYSCFCESLHYLILPFMTHSWWKVAMIHLLELPWLPLCLSTCNNSKNHWTDSDEIWYWEVVIKLGTIHFLKITIFWTVTLEEYATSIFRAVTWYFLPQIPCYCMNAFMLFGIYLRHNLLNIYGNKKCFEQPL